MRIVAMRPPQLRFLRPAPVCVGLLLRPGGRLAPDPCIVEAAATVPVTTAVFPVSPRWEGV